MGLIEKYKAWAKYPERYTTSEILCEIVADLAILNKTNTLIVKDCTTCKYQGNSKYLEPCHNCRDNDNYDNYKSNI